MNVIPDELVVFTAFIPHVIVIAVLAVWVVYALVIFPRQDRKDGPHDPL